MENALVADPPDGKVYFFGETTFYMAGPTSQGKTDIMNVSHREHAFPFPTFTSTYGCCVPFKTMNPNQVRHL